MESPNRLSGQLTNSLQSHRPRRISLIGIEKVRRNGGAFQRALHLTSAVADAAPTQTPSRGANEEDGGTNEGLYKPFIEYAVKALEARMELWPYPIKVRCQSPLQVSSVPSRRLFEWKSFDILCLMSFPACFDDFLQHMRIDGKLEGTNVGGSSNIQPFSNKRNQHSVIATRCFDASKSPPKVDIIKMSVHLGHICLDLAQP
jgi:hypothetical protein